MPDLFQGRGRRVARIQGRGQLHKKKHEGETSQREVKAIVGQIARASQGVVAQPAKLLQGREREERVVVARTLEIQHDLPN